MSHKEAGRHRITTIIAGIVTGFVIVGICLIFIVPALFMLFFSWQPYRYTQINPSPGGDYIVIVESTDGQWPFGPAKAKITVRGNRHREVYETKISDDGGKGDVHIFWLDENTAQVVLSGSEQTDEAVTITFPGGEPVLEAVRMPYTDAAMEEASAQEVPGEE